MKFNAKEWQRYQRHIQLNQIGAVGQEKLKAAKVLIVGAGGLGCPVAQYIGASGVGSITIIDGDTVALTNLHRQILFSESDIGANKATVAQSRLLQNNADISVNVVTDFFNLSNAKQLIDAADIVIDCTDNFATRYLINDLCVNSKTPWIFASVVQLSGQVAFFTPGNACFRCLFPNKPTDMVDCNSAGVLGVMPGLLAMLQVNEVIKYLVGLETPLQNTLMLVEGLGLDFRKITLRKNVDCDCNTQFDIDANGNDYEIFCATESEQVGSISHSDFHDLSKADKRQIIDVRSYQEHQGFNLGGTNIPLQDDFVNQFIKNFDDKSANYVLYCQSGKRSAQAQRLLIDADFKKVLNLDQGLSGMLKE